MALNAKLVQRITENNAAKILHSSGYASAQSGGTMGASGNTSFSERQQIEQDRKVVQNYQSSHVAQSVNRMPKAQSVEEQSAQATADAAIAESTHGLSSVERERREFNTNRESGGLRKYDPSNRDRFNSQASSAGFARQSGAAGRQDAAAARAAMAERFSGHAHPVPKSGGFGRH